MTSAPTLRRKFVFQLVILVLVSVGIVALAGWIEYGLKPEYQPEEEAAESALERLGEVFSFALLPIIVLIGVVFVTTRRLLQPVSNLTDAVAEWGPGNFDQRLPVTGESRETDQLALRLNEYAARCAKMVAGIQEFTIHASHELKTPLTILRGGMERALANPGLTEAQKEHYPSWIAEVERLNRIVSSLTLLSNADAGQLVLDKQRVDFKAMVEESIEETGMLGQHLGLRVTSSPLREAIVTGDSQRLRQILLNLADNAVKYNTAGGSVHFKLTENDRHVTLAISNTGEPIQKKEMPFIFDRFYRGSAHQREEGSGLGLSICQTFARAHGGDLTVDADQNLTTFTLTLPRA